MKRITLYIFLISLILGGCSDFLTEEPKLSQSDVLTLSTFKGLDKSTFGAYSPLYSSSWYGAAFILDSELRAGNAKNPTNTDFTSGRYTTPYAWNYNASATSGVWGFAYYVIAAVNNVINNVSGKELESGVSIQNVNNLKAECLFLRALSYFDLVRVYAQPYTYAPESLGVPIVLVTDPNGKPKRNTVKEVYTQITEDLLEAEKIIADDYTRSDVSDTKAVVSKEAIQALLSRVYLYMGKWQECADYATKVIKSGKYSMWKADELKNVWTLDIPKGGEIIFEVFASTGASYNGYWDEISWMVNPDGYADVASSADLRNMYQKGDVRGELFRSHKDATDHFWTTKYAGKGKGTPDVNNIIVLRLSEMYLNRAEALVNGATIAGVSALNDLNEITSNRGSSAYTSAGKEIVFNERRKELAFEGHIVFDYARCQKSLERTDYNGDISNQNIPFPSYKWALPIPKRECDANGNLEQNPNY